MNNFIHQITSGMAGWLTFEQMQNGVDNLREAELKKPIEQIARGRGFEVKGEFPLPKPPGKAGGPESIDFIMVHREKKLVVALELKYKKAGRRMAGSISSDAARLHSLTLDTINSQITLGRCHPLVTQVKDFAFARAVLVVWRESAIMDQMKVEPKAIRNQFLSLVKAMLPDKIEQTEENYSKAMDGLIATKPVARSVGSLRAGSTVTRKRFWVASFLHRSTWTEL